MAEEMVAMSVERKKIIELQGVTVGAGNRYDVGLPCLSLCLESGDAAVLRIPKTGLSTPLADVCCGLEDPGDGVVRFLGLPWTERSAEEMNQARGRIGRVWAGSAWVGNLDIDENIVLPQMHHTRRPLAEVREQAKSLARSFGLDDLPNTRPAWTPQNIRQKAQWVRALLGTPELLLLEFPDSDVEEADRVRLTAAVDQARARGSAVLWITAGSPPVLAESPGAVHQAEWTGGALVWRTREQGLPRLKKG